LALDEAGAFAYGPAPAGHYRLLAFLDEFGTVPLAAVDLAPHQDLLLDAVHLQVPGSATITAVDAAGELVPSGHVFVRTSAGGQAGSGKIENGRIHFASLQPGHHFVVVHFDTRHDPEVLTTNFEVQSGGEVAVDVRGRRRAQVRLSCVDPSAASPVPIVNYTCTVADSGDIAGFFATFRQNDDPLAARAELPVGSYVLEGRSSDGRAVRTAFVIGDDDVEAGRERVVELQLPAR
jgi:hypothetical protein